MANFGFSIGDIITISGLAWKCYKICKSASEAYKEVASEVLSLHTVIQEVENQALLPESLVRQQQKLEILHLLLSGCEEPLKKIVDVIIKHSSLAESKKKVRDKFIFGLEELHDARSKLTLHTSAIHVFLTTLNTSSLERIERKLDELFKAVLAGNRESTILSFTDDNDDTTDLEQQWGMFRLEMMSEGFSRVELDSSRSFVQVKIRDLMHNAPELPPAERPRKTTPRIQMEKEGIYGAQQKMKLEEPQNLSETDTDASLAPENPSHDHGKKAFIAMFSIFEDLVGKIGMDVELDVYLNSNSTSTRDLVQLERKLFIAMENLEDGFEKLHQKAENLRRQIRREAAQKLEANVLPQKGFESKSREGLRQD